MNDEKPDPRSQAPPDDRQPAGPERDAPPEPAADQETAAETEAAEVIALQRELDETQQRFLRLQAELENFRKRTQRIMDEERRYAALPLLRDLLVVVDNLQRAMTAAEQHDGQAGLLEGVQMVAGQLTDVLKKHHCEPIEAEGTRFDPHFHEAIGQVAAAELEPGTVAQVVSVGYRLHDRVVRPAQVLVATGPAETDAATTTEDSTTEPEDREPEEP